VPKRSWHLLSNPTDYWYIITIAESLCADKFLQVTFRYFLKEFKGRNIGLKNKRSHFGLVIRPSVYCLLNGVVLHCAIFIEMSRFIISHNSRSVFGDVLPTVARALKWLFFGWPNFSGKIRPKPNLAELHKFGRIRTSELRRISIRHRGTSAHL
jgi:hypothetical protein